MKSRLKNPFLLLVVIGSPFLAQAQTFMTLHSFSGTDGAAPNAGLILSRGTLYGTTVVGGILTNGTVFKINTDGSGFTNLYEFTGGTDGIAPMGTLVLASNTLYGTCAGGGIGVNGTVFALNTDGTGFTVLHSFTNSDGASPYAGLILLGNTLYGTTMAGGAGGYGTVFRVNIDASGFTNLHSFTSDGFYPVAPLVSLSNTLYGTTQGIYANSTGTVFSVNTDGTGFKTLRIDGHVMAGLVLSGNTLYGTTSPTLGSGGGYSTVFTINTDGTGYSVLHNFTLSASSDGAYPYAGLILSGNTLYGVCALDGSSNEGTIFAINTNGNGFTNFRSFTGGSDGGLPLGTLVLSGNALYGTCAGGGSAGYGGTVFSLSFTPQLNIVHSSSTSVLSWPTNYAGFDYSGFTLQSTTNLALPVWTTNFPAPVVLNGQFTITNPISSARQFYRLRQ